MLKSRRMTWARWGSFEWEKPEGKRPMRPRSRWVDNIKMDLREIRWGVMNRIDMAQDRDQLRAVVIMVTNLRIVLNIGKLFIISTMAASHELDGVKK
jgi:hypothetical protein